MYFIKSQIVSFVILLTLVAYQGALAAHFLPRQIDTSLLPALTTAIESVLSSASASASETSTSSASETSTASAAAPMGSGASGLPDVPECSEKCFTIAIQDDGCEITDLACHCSKEGQLRDTINPCLVSNCAPQERADFDHAVAIVCQNATAASSGLDSSATVTSAPAMNTSAPGPYVGYVGNDTSSDNTTNLLIIATTVSGSNNTETSSPTSNSASTTTAMGSTSTETSTETSTDTSIDTSTDTSTATSSPSETGIMTNTSGALATINTPGGVLLDIMLLVVGWAAILF